MNTYHELAEAMRKGATLRPQVQKYFFDKTENGEIGSCALGAAYEGRTGETTLWMRFGEMERLLPVLEVLAKCPICEQTNELKEIVAHINDTHRWTREAIADWLDAL